MTNRQKLYIVAGGAVIVILSGVLLYLYNTDPVTNPAERENGQETAEANGTEESEGGVDINIDGTDENSSDLLNDDEEIDESEYSEHAKTAIREANLSVYEEPSEQSFYDHAILNQEYSMLIDEVFLEEGTIEFDAQLSSKELVSWLEIAEEHGNFTYDESRFLSFIEEEGFKEDMENSAFVLVEELETENELHAIRNLETRYLKSFIWNEVKSQIKQNESMEEGETEEEFEFRVYHEFEQDVMDHLIENNPQFLEEEM